MAHPEVEGVTKFSACHDPNALNAQRYADLAGRLLAWRDILYQLGGVGQDPQRYGGAGYGNVSARVGPFPGPRGARGFLITGTQTGGQRCMGLDDLCHVSRYDIDRNQVISRGHTRPSSESMTHGAVYDLSPSIRCVLHVHIPRLWHEAAGLKLPMTGRSVAYGTIEMAREVRRLAHESRLLERQIFSMSGHEDGIVAFGRDFKEAGSALISTLAQAGTELYARQRQLCTTT